MKKLDQAHRTLRQGTMTSQGYFPHKVFGGIVHPIAVQVVALDEAPEPVFDDSGEVIYVTPGGGRASAVELV